MHCARPRLLLAHAYLPVQLRPLLNPKPAAVCCSGVPQYTRYAFARLEMWLGAILRCKTSCSAEACRALVCNLPRNSLAGRSMLFEYRT